jgi:hypothetical protein
VRLEQTGEIIEVEDDDVERVRLTCMCMYLERRGYHGNDLVQDMGLLVLKSGAQLSWYVQLV